MRLVHLLVLFGFAAVFGFLGCNVGTTVPYVPSDDDDDATFGGDDDDATNGTEICNNGIDDDGDLLVDCNDADCNGDPACGGGGTETNCTDGIDNDGDSNVDCFDTDCANDPACGGGSWGNTFAGTWALEFAWNSLGTTCYGLSGTTVDGFSITGNGAASNPCIGVITSCVVDWNTNWTVVGPDATFDWTGFNPPTVGVVSPGTATTYETVNLDNRDSGWYLMSPDSGTENSWSGSSVWQDYTDAGCGGVIGQTRSVGSYQSY